MILILSAEFLDRKPKFILLYVIFCRIPNSTAADCKTAHLSTSKTFRDNSIIANPLTQILLVLLLINFAAN
jgi:hypothetical protein